MTTNRNFTLDVIDMNTAEGMADHFHTLPVANLHRLAARAAWAVPGSWDWKCSVVAEMELIVRGETVA